MATWKWACEKCGLTECDCKNTPVAMTQRGRMSSSSRGYTYRWKKARQNFLAEHPLCERCKLNGKITQAEHVDHVVPHRGDMVLFWKMDLWQSLCASCHSRKTHKEAGAGQRYVVLGNHDTSLLVVVKQQAAEGDLVFDMDEVVGNCIFGSGNMTDLQTLKQGFRQTVLQWIRAEATNRNIWLITRNASQAASDASYIDGNVIDFT